MQTKIEQTIEQQSHFEKRLIRAHLDKIQQSIAVIESFGYDMSDNVYDVNEALVGGVNAK